MPRYTFENTKTGNIFDEEMKIAELDPFKEANPHLIQVLGGQPTLDAVRLGITKPPADFQKYVLGKIKAANPEYGHSVEKRWMINKEI